MSLKHGEVTLYDELLIKMCLCYVTCLSADLLVAGIGHLDDLLHCRNQ